MKETIKYRDIYEECVNYKYNYKKNYYVSWDPLEESEEDKIARLAREKAEKRDKKIDLILNNK
jgi:hypothetical protein